MTHPHFIIGLKKKLSQDTWSWVITALRQEPLVWDSLINTDLGMRALTISPAQPESWSPAALALQAIDEPLSLENLRVAPMQPLNQSLRNKASQTFEEWSKSSNASPLSLAQAGLVALSLRERRRLKGTWQGITAELGLRANHLPGILACLYGLVPDPFELLRALLNPSGSSPQIELALHGLLSNPLPPEKQADILNVLLDELPLTGCLAALRYLAVQRPALANRLAQGLQNGIILTGNQPLNNPGQQEGLNDPMASLTQLLQSAELRRLAAQPSHEIPILAEALKAIRRFQAHLAAQLAQAANQNADLKTELEAWKQAAQLAPQSPLYASGLARALLKAGRAVDAQAYLNTRQAEDPKITHPALYLANALLAIRQGDIPNARQAALQAYELAENNAQQPLYVEVSNIYLLQEFFHPLTQLLLDLDLAAEASRLAQIGLGQNPNDPKLLELLAQAMLSLGNSLAALPAAYLACIRQPEQPTLHRLLLESLEAAGEWQAALEERKSLLGQIETPTSSDLRALASCALSAGEPEQAALACQQALQIDPHDGLAYGLLGDARLALGDMQAAFEHLQMATQLAPNQSAPWLTLARNYQQTGQEGQAMDVLRAASLAAPNAPEIQLALGEICLANNAPTQALSSLRRAANLAMLKKQQAKRLPKDSHKHNDEEALSLRIALYLGQTLSQLGHLDESRQVLEQAYTSGSRGKTDPAVAYAYAKTLLATGDVHQALPPLEAAVQAQPDDPTLYLDYARTLMLLSDRLEEDALRLIPLLQMVLQRDPGQAEAYALLAEALVAREDLIGAHDAYRRALETSLAQDSDWRARLSLGLGRVALTLGQPETAIAALQEAALANPEDAEVQRALCPAYLAIGLVNDAFLSARAALHLEPSDLDTLIWFADQAMLLHKQPGGAQLQAQAEAIQALSRAAQLAPSRPDLLIRLGKCQMQNEDHSAALHTFSKFVTSEYDTSTATCTELFQAANNLRQLGAPGRAVVLLERAIQLKGEEVNQEKPAAAVSLFDLLSELGIAHWQDGNLAAALQVLDEALLLNSADTNLSLAKSDLLLEMNQAEAALTCLEYALSQDPADARLHQRMATILRNKGRLPQALVHAEQAIIASSDPEQSALNLRVRCLAAELAHALLRPKLARQFLGDQWPGGESSDHADQYNYACLRAELAFEAGDDNAAAEALAVALQLAHLQPRSLANQARLSLRRDTAQAALKPLKSACEAFETSHTDRQVEAPGAPQPEVISTQRALSEAALELGLWDQALPILHQLAWFTPEEPRSHYQLARGLVLQAESQRLCQALEIVQHAPGMDALGKDAYRSFEAAIQTAEQLVEKWSGAEEQVSHNQTKAENRHATYQLIQRWQARGQAVFQPCTQNAQALRAILEGGNAGPEDVAALIATLGEIGDEANATKEAQAYSQHPLVTLQLALIQARQNPRQALRITSSAVSSLPLQGYGRNNEPILLNALLARLTHRYGSRADDHDTALQCIRVCLDAWPDEPRWHALAAEIYLGNKNFTADTGASIAHLEQAIRLEPKHAAHYVALGNIYNKNGETGQAIHAFEQATRIAPEQPEAWLALAEAQVATGDMEQAASSAEQAIDRSADPVVSLLLRAEIDLQTNNPLEAHRRTEAVLQIKPDEPRALLLQARALSALNRPGEALAALDKGIPLAGQPLPLLIERARLIRHSQGLEAALDVLRGLAERYPEEPGLLTLLSDLLVEAGRSEAAIQTAQLALQSDKGKLASEEHAYLHALVGRHLRRAGQLDQAIYHLNEAIQQMPTDLETYLELGCAHQERRQIGQALSVYQQAIRVAPNDYRAYHQTGLALKESKDYLGAEAMLRRAAELAPNEVSIHRMLGAVVALNLVHNRRQTPSTQESL